jgi:predicted secreted protein
MGWVTHAAVFFIIWWTVIFLVLPWGAGASIDEADVRKGQAAGAPKRPRIPLKLAVTTLAAGALWGVFYVIVEWELVSFRE